MDWSATSASAKNKKGPKPGEHVQLFRMKRDRNKGFYSANWRPPRHCAFNGLGILCLGTWYHRFTILSRTPNGLSNDGEKCIWGPYSSA